MSRYAIRNIRLPSGEHLPVLVHSDPLGLPVERALRYTLVHCRSSGKKATTIRQQLRGLAVGYCFFDERRIDLNERAATGQFLTEDELSSLAEWCRQRDRGDGVVCQMHAATRYATCIRYIEWEAKQVIGRVVPPRRRESLNLALQSFRKSARCVGPQVDRYSGGTEGERLGFTPEQRTIFLSAIEPGAPGNPFATTLQLRNYALLRAQYDLGMRPSEVLGLKTKDFDASQHPASVTIHRRADDPDDTRTEPPAAKTYGRLLNVGSSLLRALDDWLADRRKLPAAKKHPYIFTNYRGEPLSGRGFRKVIEKLRRAYPVLDNPCLYIMRHDFNDRWIDNNADSDQAKSTRDQCYHNGWTPNSRMPAIYGKRAIRDSANRRSLKNQEQLWTRDATERTRAYKPKP